MTPIDVLLSAVRSLSSNLLRTLLTMLGIIIGIAAVITLTAASEGAQEGVTDQIRGLGSNLMFVRPGTTAQQGAAQIPGTGPGLFLEDATAIDAADFDFIDGVAGQNAVGGGQGIINAQVIRRGQNVSTTLVGTEPAYEFVRDFYVAEGRFLNEDDITKKALTTVLGSNVREKLFGNENPIGESVRISAGAGPFSIGFNFTVVGVMEEKGSSTTTNLDDAVFVPLPSFQARIPFLRNPRGYTNVNQINIKITDRSKADAAKQAVEAILLERHQVAEADFTIQSQNELLATATNVERSLQVLVVSIALISLIVGGIGIMNIMLVSVTERTREIGIRKAIGAKRMDILFQFLAEAFLVTMLGGVLGVMGGVGATRVAERFDIGGDEQVYTVTAVWVFVGLLVSGFTGIVAGVYPAWRAARLDPIEALRHE